MRSKPALRPARPYFSSGPCAKPPDWSVDWLRSARLGRYHRSAAAKARIVEALDRTRAVLGIPDEFRIVILPGSDTGAVEAALWNLLGARGVDILSWDSFGAAWAHDVENELALKDVRHFKADYGEAPDFGAVDWARDVVFVWNGTTSGVRVPDADWIAEDREGLAICDATSAAFAMALDWSKLDVATFSWQKSLGGEAGFGVAVLSPRAIARLKAHKPAWPIPKLFRWRKGGGFDESLAQGGAINTLSLLAIEDYLAALKWAARAGGLGELVRRSETSAAALWRWLDGADWAANLCAEPAFRSTTSVCLRFVAPDIAARSADAQRALAAEMARLLEQEEAAFDILGYRAAPPGLRIWCGPTVAPRDVEALTPWLDWAYAAALKKQAGAGSGAGAGA
ncbi:MAG: phosphoserine transaminase [Parvularculaceae bacterium]